ncbi:GNAT family N-acetyltransferase [Candidatus Gottesmanbacteria bacterium]|nr:GNAT family N-acetyltransferase [Candidatus Gottesmanbacteria bacterium]
MITKALFDTSLRTTWDNVLVNNAIHAPFFTYQWHELWYEVLGKDWQPYVLVVDDVIIAPFARKDDEVIFSGGEEISDYQDLIGPDEKKIDVWKQLLEFLKRDGVTSIRLRNVPQSSPTVPFFQQLPNATVTQEDTTPLMHLPSSWEAYVESLPYKNRHELRRKIRKFEREHTNVQIIESSNPPQDSNTLLLLMRKDKKKTAFLTPEMTLFFQKLAEVFKDSISLLVLTMENEPAAATLSFIHNEASLLYNSGFDKTCCPNAGWYLKAMSIKKAIEKSLKQYNFLQGSEPYKYDLGGGDFFVYTIYLRL